MINEKLQNKYDECVNILEQLHNAVGLMLAIDPSQANYSALDIITNALNQLIEIENMNPEDKKILEAQAEELGRKLKQLNPNIEIIDDRPTNKDSVVNNNKKVLLN